MDSFEKPDAPNPEHEFIISEIGYEAWSSENELTLRAEAASLDDKSLRIKEEQLNGELEEEKGRLIDHLKKVDNYVAGTYPGFSQTAICAALSSHMIGQMRASVLEADSGEQDTVLPPGVGRKMREQFERERERGRVAEHLVDRLKEDRMMKELIEERSARETSYAAKKFELKVVQDEIVKRE